jgi:hypothetical protein
MDVLSPAETPNVLWSAFEQAIGSDEPVKQATDITSYVALTQMVGTGCATFSACVAQPAGFPPFASP